MVERNGRVSNAKVWAFIGCAVSTWIMIHITLKDKMTAEMFFIYLCSVAGFSQLSKFLAYKFGSGTTATTTASSEETTTVEKCDDCPSTPAPQPLPKKKTKQQKDDEGSD